MTAKRPSPGASEHAPIPVRGSRRIVQLTRVTAPDTKGGRRTLHFTFPARTGRGRRSAAEFIRAEYASDIVGDTAWAEVEKVRGYPWNYWVALRQVEPPADA